MLSYSNSILKVEKSVETDGLLGGALNWGMMKNATARKLKLTAGKLVDIVKVKILYFLMVEIWI